MRLELRFKTYTWHCHAPFKWPVELLKDVAPIPNGKENITTGSQESQKICNFYKVSLPLQIRIQELFSTWIPGFNQIKLKQKPYKLLEYFDLENLCILSQNKSITSWLPASNQSLYKKYNRLQRQNLQNFAITEKIIALSQKKNKWRTTSDKRAKTVLLMYLTLHILTNTTLILKIEMRQKRENA